MTEVARPSAVQKDQPFDLDAAMRAKMENVFGDLSAVKNYQPPVQTETPSAPHTGPIDHALSDARPSPAAAGPMQAKRGGRKKKAVAPEPQLIQESEPRSQYAAEFDLLNSQEGSEEERKDAYNAIAHDTANNMTDVQKEAIGDYIGGSEQINTYLRGKTNDLNYPDPSMIPGIQQQANDISEGIKNNPLAENTTAYKGITDKYLALLFEQHGLKKAVNKNGTINNKWLDKNQKKMRKALIGKTFHDKAYTSTSTEKSFAQFWSRHKAGTEAVQRFVASGQDDKAEEISNLMEKHPEKVPGAHMVKFNMPKGANASFVDRTSDSYFQRLKKKPIDQREILIDKGSTFKISDIRKMEDSDSYELVMDMLAKEEGKKRK